MDKQGYQPTEAPDNPKPPRGSCAISTVQAPTPAHRLLPTDGELNRMNRIANGAAHGGIAGVNTPNEAFVRILAGWSCGVDAATALINIKSVDGRLALPEMVAVAAIRRSGIGDIRTIEVTDDHATVRVTRADWPTELYEIVTFSVADAVRAGLIQLDAKGQNNSRKDNWRKYTSDMLLARARATAKRRYLEEAVGGLPYSPEELGADTDEDGNAVNVELDRPASGWTRTANPVPDALPAAATAVTPATETAKPTPAWQQPSAPIIVPPPEQPLDDVHKALCDVFNPATADQRAEAKRLFKTLELDAVTWAVIIGRERAGAKSIKELTTDRAGELLAKLEKVRQLRLLRVVSNLSDESWTNALKKRAVTKDVLLPAAAVDEIFAKLYDQVTPFKRQEIGVDPAPVDSTAGKALPSPSASQELQAAAA